MSDTVNTSQFRLILGEIRSTDQGTRPHNLYNELWRAPKRYGNQRKARAATKIRIRRSDRRAASRAARMEIEDE